MNRVHPLSLPFFLDKLDKNVPFSFARYGDGEWHAILGTTLKQNCDGHEYWAEMNTALTQAVLDQQSYYYATLAISQNIFGDRIWEWCDQNHVTMPWYEGDFLLHENLRGGLLPFWERLRQRRVMLIAPAHLLPIQRVIGITTFCEVPAQNSFRVRNRVGAMIRAAVRDTQIDTVLFCAGFMTKVVINDVFPQVGDRLTMIDIGSFLDPYVGKKSRSYSWLYDWNKLRKANFG